MSARTTKALFFTCLLFMVLSVSGKDQAASAVVAEALSKIRTHSAYRLARSLAADLAPGSSGAMVPVTITETAVVLVVRTGAVSQAHESSTIRKRLSPFRMFSRGAKETRATVWDGSWIYSWGCSNKGIKMADVKVNRDAAIVDNLYVALLEDDGLLLREEKAVDGKRCALLESSSEILTQFLYVPGKAMIVINRDTGFPVRISVQSQNSKATVNYEDAETHPAYRSDEFVPPPNIVFETVKGREDSTRSVSANNPPEANKVPAFVTPNVK